MKCLLMNKNTKVALIEYNTKFNAIESVYTIYNIEYSPLSVLNAYHNTAKNLADEINNWFRNRGIPSWRKDLENLLKNLNVSTAEELLNKAYGLSLSDQYWIKEEDSNIKWENINFFNNDFKYKGYLEASLSSSKNSHIHKAELMSPNNTTDGMLQKGWIIEDGKRVLVKGIYQVSREEPINEWLASEICDRLGFVHCEYSIDIIDNKIVSKCDNFISENEELVSAYDVFNSKKKENHISDYEHYVRILEEHKIPLARKNVEDMFILDYLIVNIDRHMKNFGIIRDVQTLVWKRVAPIFDNGESMQCDKLTNEINFVTNYGKFFSNTHKNYNDILGYIENISRIDLTKLNGLVLEYRDKLEQYREYMDISNERIEKLCDGLDMRIKLLKQYIEKQ